MSKPDSGLFKRTSGSQSESLPSYLRRKLLTWATVIVNHMPRNISKTKRNRFNTACVVYDEATGKLYFGRNGGINKDGDGLHPILRSILPKTSLNKHPVTWSCAESDAVNMALHDGVRLRNMHLYVMDVSEKWFGKEKKSCENCRFALEGIIGQNYTGWKD